MNRKFLLTTVLVCVLLFSSIGAVFAAGARVQVTYGPTSIGRYVKLKQSNGLIRSQKAGWWTFSNGQPYYGAYFSNVPTGWTTASFVYLDGLLKQRTYNVYYSWANYYFDLRR